LRSLDLNYSAFSAFYLYPINAAGFAHYHSSLILIWIYYKFALTYSDLFTYHIRLIADHCCLPRIFFLQQCFSKEVFWFDDVSNRNFNDPNWNTWYSLKPESKKLWVSSNLEFIIKRNASN
jgi:hypothetical protein